MATMILTEEHRTKGDEEGRGTLFGEEVRRGNEASLFRSIHLSMTRRNVGFFSPFLNCGMDLLLLVLGSSGGVENFLWGPFSW